MVLVAGATGATGRLLVRHLLERGEYVRAVVRSTEKLSEFLGDPDRLTMIGASILDSTDAELAEYVEGCGAVASCLGHNLSFKGVYGPPRRLVTDAVRRLCDAVKANKPQQPVRLVLMNTAGNANRDLREPVSPAQRAVVGLLRVLVPPHADNESAADYLRTVVGPADPTIEWAAVRPDTLANEDAVTEYEVFPSPIRSAIFNAGSTSRINVAHFMARLITEDGTWKEWKGRMPVIYNAAKEK